MKYLNEYVLLILLLISSGTHAQIGIGTISPDPSSNLELQSITQGFLPARMTTEQQALIANPAVGLIVFNSTNNDLEINTGTPAVPNWKGSKGGYETVYAPETTTTASLVDVVVSGMVLNPPAGTYAVSFNSQYNNALITATTPQMVADLKALYSELKAKPATNTNHGPLFGNATATGEVLTTGVYALIGESSVNTNLTFDAAGDSSALFIIRVLGAFSTAANATMILANGASANNVFWVIDGAVSLAAGTIMKGTILSNGYAIAGASGVNLEGRLLTTNGAINYGPAIAAIPAGNSVINLGLLAPFVIFSGNGDVTNTAVSYYTGDIGNIQGLMVGFNSAYVNGTIRTANSFDTPGILIDNTNKVSASFSIYQNGVLIPSSIKTLSSGPNTANVSLQAIASVDSGQPIEVRWKTGSDKIEMGNRTLTAIKVQ